jgi:hypothetical protein
MQQYLPGPLPLPARNPPAPDQRQAACTHITVTRLFDNYGVYRCQMCRRHPSIGWVYRCTQDHEAFLPESDFTTIRETAPVVITDGKSVWRLKQWMYEAVLKGQYTVEQFSTLFQQRQGVKKAIFSECNSTARPANSVLSDDTSNSADITSITLTSIASSYSDEGSELRPCENGISYQVKHERSTPDGRLVDEPDISTIKGTNTARDPSYPACAWTCCQSCRPTYRDRAWLSLDAVVNEPTRAPPSWEFENRRISDARIVATMGLPMLSLPSQVEDSRYDSSSEAPLSSDSNLAESETDRLAYGGLHGIRTKIRTKGAFRETVRRTLKGTVGHTRGTSTESETSSKNSSKSSLRRFGRSMLSRPRGSSQSTISYNPRVIEDGQLQESLMLMIAANTPLPDAAASIEDLHDGEVEVEDGVAVTEEGVGMSAADIIMQV